MESLKVCYAYEYEGKTLSRFSQGMDLSQVVPVYKEIPGFNDVFYNGKISPELLSYIKILEDFIEVPVGVISYGPSRNQTIFKRDYLS